MAFKYSSDWISHDERLHDNLAKEVDKSRLLQQALKAFFPIPLMAGMAKAKEDER